MHNTGKHLYFFSVISSVLWVSLSAPVNITAAFDQPLLQEFNDILFVERATRTNFLAERNESEGGHMCDQYYGHNAAQGGGLFILKNFRTGWPGGSGISVAGNSAIVSVQANISGGQTLTLVVEDGGDGNGNDHADWADARLTTAGGQTVYISDLNYTVLTNGYGPAEKDMSNGEAGAGDGGTITLKGTTYAKGLGVHAESRINVPLNGQYTAFASYFGIDDEKAPAGSVAYKIFLDGVQIVPAAAGGPYARKVNLLEGLTVPSGSHAGTLMTEGAVISPELSYDGTRVLFAWSRAGGEEFIQDNRFHLFGINIDGTGLTRLTDGDFDDFDPCFLPGGRVAFISTRRGGKGRCHGRNVPTYSLHSMKADGSDIICLSYHETNEYQPSVTNDGMITYTRWDYIDREDCIAHHLWICYPDGRDPRAPHANYPVPLTTLTGANWPDGRSVRPFAEYNIRAIPGSPKFVATAGPHHHESFGSLILIDTRIEDDNMMSQVERLTPDEPFPESESGVPGGPSVDMDYGTAWPLSEDLYLVNRRFGLYAFHRGGLEELIYESTNGFRPIDPIPVMPRPQPPIIPAATWQGERHSTAGHSLATISVMNVYISDEFGKLPDNVKVDAMRIVQVFPKSTNNKNWPYIGPSESLARMPLGTVPVEEDGSVYFKAPVNKEIYFQLLDSNGLAVQTMRSGTYVHPGEQMSCTGCHESKWDAVPVNPSPLAMQRPPSDITPEAGGLEPVNFYRLVKPVLDDNCADCHVDRGAIELSYDNLMADRERKSEGFAFGFPGDQRSNYLVADYGGSRSVPGEVGTYRSRLYRGGFLDASHYDVALSPDAYRRITLWLDLNSNELGAYYNENQQRQGQLVWPLFDVDPQDPQGLESGAAGCTDPAARNFDASASINNPALCEYDQGVVVTRPGYFPFALSQHGSHLALSFYEAGPHQVRLLDIRGNTIQTSTVSSTSPAVFNLKNSGVYIMYIHTGGKLYRKTVSLSI